jgi:hypothetical protein
MHGASTLFRRYACASLVALLAATSSARAQQSQAHIGYVFPAGGSRGSTTQVKVGGQGLANVRGAHICGTGVQAEFVEYVKPLSQRDFNLLRDKLKELLDRKAAATQPWTDDDDKTLDETRRKLANPPKKPPNPAIDELAILKVTIDAKAEPGPRELRLQTPAGLTNPLVFCVSTLPEFQEAETNEDPTIRKPDNPRRFRERPPQDDADNGAEPTVTLPVVINGQIMPGDVDRYHFKARKGQNLVIAASAQDLIPYLPDAVPGWFQATLALLDTKGKELAYCDDYRFNPDPVIFYQVPRDGEYVVEIRDSVYRGREDFVYRISMGGLPFITSIFPLGGKVGEPTTLELTGRNLPQTHVTYSPKSTAPGLVPISAAKGSGTSNRLPFMLDTLPECVEKEPNNEPATAQAVTLPIVINGRIDPPNDADTFQFEGHAGDEIVAEVYARRLESPLDSFLVLSDSTGKQLAFNDDHEDKGAGLTTHHADSFIRFKLPADGSYLVRLTNQESTGGPEYAYRLRISPPEPDFALRVVPSSINIRGPSAVAVTAFALRKDGFAGEIELTLKDAPPGMKLNGGRVAAGQEQVRFTLTGPSDPPDEPFNLTIEGRATIDGKQVVRSAVPADDMMQAFAYHHLVPARELTASASGPPIKHQLKVVSELPIKIPAGGTARVRITGGGRFSIDEMQFELSEPPEGITIVGASRKPEGTEIVLKSDATKAKIGTKGNLIVNVSTDKMPRGAKQPKANNRRIGLGTLPAISFEVVRK